MFIMMVLRGRTTNAEQEDYDVKDTETLQNRQKEALELAKYVWENYVE